MTENFRVPRTRVPEVVKKQPTFLSVEERLARVRYWDMFIANLNTRPDMTLKERWEEIDRRIIAERNERIGWKGK